jgi:hypothetical protein
LSATGNAAISIVHDHHHHSNNRRLSPLGLLVTKESNWTNGTRGA